MNKPTEWSKQELVAYILLYAANSNFEETNKERDFIMSKVDRMTFQQVHDEFEADNDYQCLQKIIKGVDSHDYFRDDYKWLLEDIKAMFFVDDEYDHLEQNMFLMLKKILQK